MSGIVLDWPACAESGPAVAGGKGWQLGRLSQFGVPVPPGFALAAVASRGHRPGSPLPQAVADALAAALIERNWQDMPMAVRSSAPMEDSGRASFAGIHLSRLNVRGPQAVAQAVLDVWNSLWTPQAVAYRQRMGMADEAAAMAVVIMPLLPAEASGIAFTVDPVTGRDDQIVIHACWGLGEGLVGGQVDGDEYRLQETHPTGQLVPADRRIGTKARMTRPLAGGSTELSATPAGLAGRPVLTPEQATELGELARDAADALDYTQSAGYDIEWVWDGTGFWIVQARPITARGRHTYPALQGTPAYWTRGNTREVLPEPLSPLDWQHSRTIVNRMLTRSYALCGYPILPGAQRAALHYGRLYLEASLLQWEAFDSLGVEPDQFNRLMGGHQPAIAVPRPRIRQRWARAVRLLRYLRKSKKPRRLAGQRLDEAQRRAAVWRREELPADNAEMVALLRRREAVAGNADDLFFLQASGGGTLFNLIVTLEKHVPGEGHALAAALMAGAEASVTATQSYELMELARIAQLDRPALAWLSGPDRTGTDWQRELPIDSPFRRAFADFIERYGHRGIYESYLRNPRWREAPDYLFDAILGLIGTDPEEIRRRQRAAAEAAWTQVRNRLPFWLRPMVRSLVRLAVIDCNNREAARSALTGYLEGFRHIALELGRRFAGAGGLDRPDDVFNLTSRELMALAEGRLPVAAAACRARERRGQLERWAAESEPELVVRHGEAAAAAPVAAAAGGRSWRGTPIGGGRACGRIRIARTPADGLAMVAGEVLVAPSTDPAWTPLFLKAAALVMETGGTLSHGAIVAREFGIPAVVNLPGILAALKDGEEVEVDGNLGLVRRLAADAPPHRSS